MRKANLIICLGILLLILGCAHSRPVPIKPLPKEINTLLPGSVQKKMVGETMLEKASLIVLPGFIAMMDYQPPNLPPIAKGMIWICESQFESGLVCKLPEMKSTMLVPTSLGLMTAPAPGPFLIIKPDGQLYGVYHNMPLSVGIREFKNVPSGLFKNMDIPTRNSFRQEFIYNGKTKDTLKISYREFKDDMARPAFYQDLNYDLSESKIIGFRDIRIEVIEGTNTDIKFMVKN